MKHSLKNAARIAYAVCVLGILMIPGAVTVFRGNKTAEPDNAENRTLAAFPETRTEDGSLNRNYFSELEAWFSEHFALRSELVTAYGTLSRSVFGVSPEPDVIIGKDGWLYYAETVDDITGVQTCTDREIAHMRHNLELMQEYTEAHGAKLIVAVAPDKGSIYPQHLPARYLQTGGKNNLDALYEALKPTGISVCDWRGALQSHAGDRQLYHKLDTHWNNDGAMLGYDTLMQTAGLDSMGFSGTARTETHDWTGDLWKMLSPTQERPDDNSAYALPQTWKAAGRMRSVDDITIRTTCSDGDRSLLIFRDSFARALIPMLSQRFASCTYSRAEAVPLDLLETAQTDFVVYERVERELRDLVLHAPQMPAPVRNLTLPQTDAGRHPVLTAEPAGAYLHCSGTFAAEYGDCDAVYVTVNGTSYEAFLCCETEDAHDANGFALYLPADAFRTGDALTVTVLRGGTLFDAGTVAAQITEPTA